MNNKLGINVCLHQNQLQRAFEYCLHQIDKNLKRFETKFPSAASVELNYFPVENNEEWTQGFWTGMLWLAYEITGDKKYSDLAEGQVESFLGRIVNKIGVDHHDMGFLYTLSCVASYKLKGNENGKKAALLAADHLLGRYQEKGRFIQAWGEIGREDNYRLIIDCFLNLPLLYWASEVTGDPKYGVIAKQHFDTAVDLVIREDYSTHHTYFFDPVTGAPKHGTTAQGYSSESAWARGQAWGIYGLPLTYGYTKEKSIIDRYYHVTDFFLDRLPQDFVPCWDLIFTGNNIQRDSSAAAIAVCGMLEMKKLINMGDKVERNALSATDFESADADMGDKYEIAANNILSSLICNYTTRGLDSNGILLHGVYSIPHGGGIDECNIWGDYFYMEALVRMMKKDWVCYW